MHRSTQRLRGAIFFSFAFASSGALLSACVEQRPLFAEIAAAPDSASSGVMNMAGVPAPSAPEAPDEAPEASDEAPEASDVAPPFAANLTGMAGAAGMDKSEDPLPSETCESFDAGAPPLGCGGVKDETCSDCLSNACPDVIESCSATPGCEAISECARSTGCLEGACYCGTVNPVLCATTGEGNGPCRDVILAAPESHEPTPVSPNGGPAAEAAQLVGNCRRANVDCGDVCGGPGG